MFIKLTTGTFINASRDKRELSVIRELGIPSIVIAKGDLKEIVNIDSWLVHRLTTRPLGKWKGFVKINRLVSVLTWARYTNSLSADVISCHDHIALFIGWLSNIGKSNFKRAKLVYDAHEFEAGRNTDGNRGAFMSWLTIRLEKFLISKTVLNLMVNDTIADEVQKLHGIKIRPTVIRNIPPLWELNNATCAIQRLEFCNKLKVPNSTFLIMYHGGITSERGIEQLIQAIPFTNETAAIILGNGEIGYMQKLKYLAKNLQISQKILFHDAVPQQDLWKYVGAVDVGVCILQNVCINHYYALPNKLFENIQSLTPVIGSNFPEIQRIIDSYHIGICCDPSIPRNIANSIEHLYSNKNFYNYCKENLIQAKFDLCWEKEKIRLATAYNKIL